VVRIAPPRPNAVSRYDDPPDEILDLGRGGRGERRETPPSLPPLHIGDQPPGDDENVDRPRWWQWGALAIAIAASLVVGVLGSNARRDAADIAAAESEVDLIVGTPLLVNAPETPFQVPLYNAGPLEVELLWIRPEGWTIADTAVRHPIAIPPDRWVPIRVRALPDCTNRLSPDVLEVRVQTQAQQRTISLPLPSAGIMRDVSTQVCRSFGQVGSYVDDVERMPPPRPDILSMRLHMRAFDPSVRFTLIDLNASAPGFRMVEASLPVQFEPGAQTSPVDVTWEIADCDLTQGLNDIYLGLGFRDDNGHRQSDGAQLPGRGVAELARFGVEQCSGGS
jgi:hypothetical protein